MKIILYGLGSYRLFLVSGTLIKIAVGLNPIEFNGVHHAHNPAIQHHTAQ